MRIIQKNFISFYIDTNFTWHHDPWLNNYIVELHDFYNEEILVSTYLHEECVTYKIMKHKLHLYMHMARNEKDLIEF